MKIINSRIAIFLVCLGYFLGFFNDHPNVMTYCFIALLGICAVKDAKYNNMKKDKDESDNSHQRMRQIYKELELGVRN